MLPGAWMLWWWVVWLSCSPRLTQITQTVNFSRVKQTKPINTFQTQGNINKKKHFLYRVFNLIANHLGNTYIVFVLLLRNITQAEAATLIELLELSIKIMNKLKFKLPSFRANISSLKKRVFTLYVYYIGTITRFVGNNSRYVSHNYVPNLLRSGSIKTADSVPNCDQNGIRTNQL